MSLSWIPWCPNDPGVVCDSSILGNISVVLSWQCEEKQLYDIYICEEKRQIQDAFRTLHPHISQTSIELHRVDIPQGGMLFGHLGVISRGRIYAEHSHGHDGERGHSCFSERVGAWVDPPLGALLGRVPYRQLLVISVSFQAWTWSKDPLLHDWGSLISLTWAGQGSR